MFPVIYNVYKERTSTMIPKDPAMLLSYVNLKLRDFYGSLQDFCDDMDISEKEITEKLASIDYHYDKEKNQFV